MKSFPAAVAGLLSIPLLAQEPAPVNPPPGAGEAAVQLDPFEVKTSQDSSYGALNSNSVTRFNIELNKTPISADIFTETFIQDVDATTVNGLLQNYGAGAGMVLSNPSSDALMNQPGDRVVIGDRFTPQQLGVRGLSAGNIRRDGFEGFPTNTSASHIFDVERVDVLRGPQGLLYGAGGAGGTIVTTTKQAKFNRTAGSVLFSLDKYGSKRGMVDANYGNDWAAARFVFINQATDTRRENIGDDLKGYYGQFAFRLPLHTILRVEGEYTNDLALTPTATALGTTVNFGGVANDPRSGYSLAYLLYTNQLGATNPATGAAFSKYGAIDNGLVNWSNYDSFGGYRQQDQIQNYILEAKADTLWTKWLSTTVGANFNRSTDRSSTYNSVISAPLLNGNPFNNWAASTNMQDVLNQQLYKEFRASALVTWDFFSGKVKTQTSGGYDTRWRGYGAIDDGYFLSDGNGNIAVNSSVTTNLGRTAIPTQFWTVDNGPVLYPFGSLKRGAPSFVSPLDGKTYLRTELNPRSPAYITPGNPLGDASLYEPVGGTVANPGVAGVNQGGYGEQVNVRGYYFSNYTGWFDDWVTSLVGYRMTNTHTHIPNGSSNIFGPGKDYVSPANYSDPSYNLGLDGRILRWLRWYGSISSTYNDGVGQDDPLGNPPPTTYAHGWEGGLKFTPFNGRISGSAEYYHTSDQNDNVNYGGNIINAINPAGLNGTYTGPAGRNSFVAVDEKSSGVELIVNANITPNWRLRIAATQSNGKVLSTKRYGIVYNDQFYTDNSGNVTYKDGSPFLVPVTPGTNISGLSTAVNPATILVAGVAAQQLTTAMIGNPASPYYAWQGGVVSPAGNILSTSNVGRVLKNFTVPNVGTALTGALNLPISKIQYAWPDPNNTGGSVLVANTGDPTTGYPEYQVRFTSAYEIDRGWLKGLGFITSLSNSWQNRTYIYNNVDGTRPLFSQPELGWQVNQNFYYRRKIGRYVFRTQLDVFNLTNHYLLTLAPNNGSGFNTPSAIGVIWTGQPRSFMWTNTISF